MQIDIAVVFGARLCIDLKMLFKEHCYFNGFRSYFLLKVHQVHDDKFEIYVVKIQIRESEYRVF